MDRAGSEASQAVIRTAGLRITRQRVAVLDAVGASPHASAAAVLAAVSVGLPGVSHQAIYDCLAHLTDAGLLRRMVVDGGPAVFETRTHDNHHHCICRGCGLIVDVDCATGSAPCLDVVDAYGFAIDEAEITYRGLCPSCRATPAAGCAPFDFPKENDIG